MRFWPGSRGRWTSLARVGLGDSLTSPDRSARRRCGGTVCTTSPRACCWACPPASCRAGPIAAAVAAGQAARRHRGRSAGAAMTDADSIGDYVRSRFGDEVHERLVDPLVGSIYAADTDDFSLAAVPQLAELAARSRSVLLAGRRRPAAPAGPVFYTPLGGHGSVRRRRRSRRSSPVGGERFAVTRPSANWPPTGRAGGSTGRRSTASSWPARLVPQRHSWPVSAPAVGHRRLAAIPTAGCGDGDAGACPSPTGPNGCTGLSGYLVPKPQQRSDHSGLVRLAEVGPLGQRPTTSSCGSRSAATACRRCT